MSRVGLITLIAILAATSAPAGAKTREGVLPLPEERAALNHYNGSVLYGVSSDFADSRSPRTYSHVLGATVDYTYSKNWSLGLNLNLKADTINGQIPKGEEQGYTEVLYPSTAANVSYLAPAFEKHSWGFTVYGQPLWDEDARLEGHRALIGSAGNIQFFFFNKRYSMSHTLDTAKLINTYRENSKGTANPDHFFIYKWRNDLRFARTYKATYAFGAKVTRYLDNFVGYSYTSTFSISKTWNNFTATLSYDNGGFTDDGYIRLWYVDEYRRIFRLMMNYAF